MAHSENVQENPAVFTLAAVGRFLCGAHTAARRSDDLVYLQNMSDDQLAKRGIKREDIARHVFGDLNYI